MTLKCQSICICIVILTLSHCGIFEPNNENSGNPEIEFKVSGGFWGGTIEHLVISKQGDVTLKTGYPELSLDLTESQHDSILAPILKVRLLGQTEYLWSSANDAIDIEIRINNKSYFAHYSYLYMNRNEPGIEVVYQAVVLLYDLSNYTYEHSAPWTGLVFDAFPRQKQYAVGDTIEVVYSLSNPTERSRAVLFPHQNQILFQAECGNCTGYCFLYPAPDDRYSDDSPPSAINLEPGESWQTVLQWPQPYIDHHGDEMILEPGVYEIGMNMANGGFTPIIDSFEVVEFTSANIHFH